MRISDWSSDVCSSDLVWPAQAAGIAKLRDNSSFVLCTPTGSGKTTVATLGAVQGLFADPPVGGIDRQSVVSGKSVSVRVDLGGRRLINKKTKITVSHTIQWLHDNKQDRRQRV